MNPEADEDGQEEVIRFKKLEYIGDGIVVEKTFIYYGDGIYAEQQPQKQCREDGQGSDRDNPVLGWEQKNNQGNKNWYNLTKPVHTIYDGGR